MLRPIVLNRPARRKLESSGRLFEYQVLVAIFNVQLIMGKNTRGIKYQPTTWKFASRKLLCVALGIGYTRSSQRRIKKAVDWLASKGRLFFHTIGGHIGKGNEHGATRFWIPFDSVRFLLSLFFGPSGPEKAEKVSTSKHQTPASINSILVFSGPLRLQLGGAS